VIGQYNVSNLLGVLAALRALGVPLERAVRAAPPEPVPGRMQQMAARPAAGGRGLRPHPDALEKALRAAPAGAARGGRLWCVFGCGGDRDAASAR
jgi:UDP-N-acetylmuramoyl-L-alanyl-D-glutamate--2,6-diaminopimelate ligase